MLSSNQCAGQVGRAELRTEGESIEAARWHAFQLGFDLFRVDLADVDLLVDQLSCVGQFRVRLAIHKEVELDHQVVPDLAHAAHRAHEPALELGIPGFGDAVDRLRRVGGVVPFAVNQLEAGQRLEDRVHHRGLNGADDAETVAAAEVALQVVAVRRPFPQKAEDGVLGYGDERLCSGHRQAIFSQSLTIGQESTVAASTSE